jgi:hypothetical protein
VQLVLKRYNDSVTTADVTSNWVQQEDFEGRICNKVLVGSFDVHFHNLAGHKHENLQAKQHFARSDVTPRLPRIQYRTTEGIATGERTKRDSSQKHSLFRKMLYSNE